MLILSEDQAVALHDAIHQLVESTAVNSSLLLRVAHEAGIELPYSIESVNEQATEQLKRLDAVFGDDLPFEESGKPFDAPG